MTDTPEGLLPCRLCGAHYVLAARSGGNDSVDLWICRKHTTLGGDCVGEITRPTPRDIGESRVSTNGGVKGESGNGLTLGDIGDDVRERVREWALDKAATHHRLAHENKHLRGEHIASSSAYRNLADEFAALSVDRVCDKRDEGRSPSYFTSVESA